jgi:quinol monooxygenase YgiN
MIIAIASVRVKAGKVPEFLERFKSNVPRVKKERGCIEYFPAVDVQADVPLQSLNENVVTIIERWESLEAFRDHVISHNMRDQQKRKSDMVEEITVKVLQET